MKTVWLITLVSFTFGCGHPDHNVLRRGLPRVPVDSTPRSADGIPEASAVSKPPVRQPDVIASEPLAMPTNARDEAAAIAALGASLEDAFFGYDRSDLLPEAIAALRHDATLLLAVLYDFPDLKVAVEGHCDERGSAEYNLGLGDFRASTAASMLRDLGVPAERLQPISYGKERPQCTDSLESCRSRNRRVHLSAWSERRTRSN